MSFFAIVALIMAAWMILLGIPLMFNSKDIHAILDGFAKPTGSLLSLAFITIAFSVIILGVEYRLLANNWMWVIPLVGWLGLVKGAFIILFPESMRNLIKKFYKPGTNNMICGLITALLGVFFLWLAFSVY
ncbi:hypothetical protein DRH29_01495 [candidate division Kazan bacterium]|uniref:DUF2065 domain-containing protein n=1 Tax=candidate division Kazan bacterium TaxID=2202143 RepID=A0A420ZDD6_UNCK3|nr:MAG: hypothetical protein DRH29_01495 [candidate division Kazan bacterium]